MTSSPNKVIRINEHPPFRVIDHDWNTMICLHCGHPVEIPISCGNRFCPTCQRSRHGRVKARLNLLINSVPRIQYFPFKFVTLTIPNTKTIEEGVDQCLDGFRRLRGRKWWKTLVKGGVFVLEVTQRPTGYHVHLHIVCQARFLDMQRLSLEWSKCSAGRIVNVKKIKAGDIVAYLTKYLTKAGDDISLIIDAGHALKGRRLFQPFGLWHNINAVIPKVTFHCPKCNNSTWQLDFLLQSEFDDSKCTTFNSVDEYREFMRSIGAAAIDDPAAAFTRTKYGDPHNKRRPYRQTDIRDPEQLAVV